MLFWLIETIQSGEEGIARALYTMRDGIWFCLKYTEENKAALKLYYLSLSGKMKPSEELVEVE
jgi:hypothetical protein